jgi:osmotically-inducible protein OsmY
MNDAAKGPFTHTEILELLAKVRGTLRSERLLGPSFHLRDLGIEPDGSLVLEGEVNSVAAKKLALEHVAAIAPSVTCIVDRLHVRPATPMSDKEIRVHVRNALIAESSLWALEICEREGDECHLMRGVPMSGVGAIEIEVADGIVVLNGRVPGLSSKRLAGVIAWWVPGVRDVFNGIEVDPPEEDSSDLIVEAVRAVLERDPFVNAGQIGVDVTGTRVHLTGRVPNETERAAAERDTWCLFGVDDVVNDIKVQP